MAFCTECGTRNPDTNQFCNNCGKPLSKNPVTAAPQQAVPVPVPPEAAPPAPAAPPLAAPQPGKPRGSPVAGGIGLLAGIVSLFYFPYVLGILAIVLGGFGVVKSGNRRRAGTLAAFAAVILGVVTIILNLFYLEIFPPADMSALVTWIAFF